MGNNAGESLSINTVHRYGHAIHTGQYYAFKMHNIDLMNQEMKHKYIERRLEQVVKQAVKEFPAIVLTGPRQSGKTTLLKHLFSQIHRYVSLELPDVRAAAAADPRAFLEMNPPPVIFDEVQYAPDLLPYIKENIDSNRDKKGQYLLTGSQNLILQ
ncbi:MAG: AAA family ATPase [bacterium]